MSHGDNPRTDLEAVRAILNDDFRGVLDDFFASQGATKKDVAQAINHIEEYVRVTVDVARQHIELRIAEGLAVVIEEIRRLQPPAVGHTTIHVASRPEEDPNMPPIDHMPDIRLPSINDEAVLEVIGPKKADGSYAVPETTQQGFKSSDDANLPLDEFKADIVKDADGNPVLDEAGNQIPVYSAVANTPADPSEGQDVSGTVTWDAPGMATVDVKVVYGTPALGHAAITVRSRPEQ